MDNAAVSCFRLEDRTVHVWVIPIRPSDFKVTGFHDLLSSEERTRSRKFRFDHLRQSFIFTRGTLRILLGRYLELAPEAISFRYSGTGKPYVDIETSLRFNTSHSGDIVLFAFARNCDVGVDVEQIRALPDMDGIVHRFFCPEEVSQFTLLPPAERENAFFHCWTRKEAYLKATGNGLSTRLDSFCVTLLPSEPARVVRIRGMSHAARAWTLHDLAFSPKYAATVAYRDALRPLRLLSLETASDLLGIT